MKIFYDTATWGGKINFVDKNNVLVGFDMNQSCCESFDWYICDEIDTSKETSQETIEQLNAILEDWYFDTTFCGYPPHDHCETSFVVFKLLNPNDGKPKYLHFYNCHNGYYGHGFDMTCGDKNLYDGTL